MRTMIYLAALFLVGAGLSACKDDGEPDPGPKKSICGDGICADDETADSCPEDCEEVIDDPCGDGVCADDETFETCPKDCPRPPEDSRCGDGICDADETADSCAIDCDDAFDDGLTCVAVYDLDATMEIVDTPGGQGDSVNSGLPGQLALRYRQSDDDPEQPADGARVEILHFFVKNEMEGTPANMVITTKVAAFTPTCNGTTDIDDKKNLPASCDFDAARDVAAQATGVYQKDDAEVVWQRCNRPAAYDNPDARDEENNPIYTPDDVAEGPGCLADYHSQGNVNCEGNLCTLGGLDKGDNIQDEMWTQPLEEFTLSADGTSVTLADTRLPNREMSNTFLFFTGTRTSIDCEE